MAIVLNPCVKQILCGLSQPLRAALSNAIAVTKVELQAELLALQAKLVQYDIAAAGAQILLGGAQAALAQARAATQLVPITLIVGCTDLGDVNLGIQTNIDSATRRLAIFTQKLTRILSVRDEINDGINSINATIALFDAVTTAIATC